MSCHQLVSDATYFEDLGHHTTCHHGRPLREPPDKLIQKLFGTDLEMDWVSAIAHEIVQGMERE